VTSGDIIAYFFLMPMLAGFVLLIAWEFVTKPLLALRHAAVPVRGVSEEVLCWLHDGLACEICDYRPGLRSGDLAMRWEEYA
jgi:hypothetical protein